jgi:hypothetical protein
MQAEKCSDSTVRLPEQTELILFLIKEDLKSERFFEILRTAGLGNCSYQPDLSSLILAYTGLYDELDDTWEFYFQLLRLHSYDMPAREPVIAERAKCMYNALVAEKERRKLSKLRQP